MHAAGPEPVYATPIASSSCWMVPSSPSLPCSAMKATSGFASSRLPSTSPSASTARTSWPRRASASCACAPERSETVRSSERPPFSTTTLRAAPTAANPRSAVPAAARGRTGAPARQLDDVRERRVLARRALLLCRGGARAGQRADQAYLRAHRAADPSNPLEDHLLAVAREVQPHRGRAAAPVHVGGAPGDERDSLGRAREREQVGRVDPLIERRPD